MVYFRFPSVLWIFLLKFSGLHYCSIFKVLFIAFYLTTSNVVNGEGGIWTLAPLLTTYSLSRGAPSASLGTSPNTGSYRYRYTSSGRFKAERMGFEPMCPWRQTVFKTASLWPLRYLSVFARHDRRKCYNIKCISLCQQLFLNFFKIFFISIFSFHKSNFM